MHPDENNNRPTSFAEATTKTKWAMEDSINAITKWSEKESDRLQDAADALAEETEDKGFFGKLLTIGTTLGCYFLSPLKGSLGECVAIGAAAGGATRYIVDDPHDFFPWGDAEEKIPTGTAAIETKYYANKIPEISKELDEGAETLRDYNANEWKQDIMLQLGDSLSALQMANLGSKLGGLTSKVPIPSADTVSVTEITDPIFNLDEILDLNWQDFTPTT